MSYSISETAAIKPVTTGLFYRQHDNKMLEGITIKAGQNLKRGCLLAKETSTSKYKAFDHDASDTGKEVLLGVLGDDVNATDEDLPGWMFVEGEFNSAALSAVDADALNDAISTGIFNNYGTIIIKETD
jgi:hypothetical protein